MNTNKSATFIMQKQSFAIGNALVEIKRPKKIYTIARKANAKPETVAAFLRLLKRYGLSKEIQNKWILTSVGRKAFENRLLGVVGGEPHEPRASAPKSNNPMG